MIVRFLDRHSRSPRKALAADRPPHIPVAECLHALEPRHMFDAAGVATGAETAVDAVAQEQAEQAVDNHLNDSGAADAGQASDASPADNADANDQLLEALATHQPPAGRREVVFVDTSVEGYQKLIAGIDPSAEVVLLDATRDGVEQIADVLAGRSGIDAIHIVSHGTQAELRLGTARLTLDSMAGRYVDELAVLGQALTDEADLLVYGCNFGEGGEGQEAATILARITGADVAASEDATGHTTLGGDWNLEFRAGAIETKVALSEQAQAQWDGLLATVAVDTTNDVRDGDTSSIANLLANKGADGNISLREAVIATNNTAGADTITLSSGTYMLSIGGSTDNSGDLDIRDTLTLNGAGAASTIIDANGVDRVLDVHGAGTLYLTGITLTDGSAGLDGGGLNVQSGGAATVAASIISGNSAGTSGGGIYNQGTLTLDQVRISGNDAGTAGGGIYNDGVATVTRSLIDNNTAGTNGGGIRNTGAGVNLDLTNVTISANTASLDGGGLSSSGPATLQNVTISANSASSNGGGIDVSGGTTSLKNTIVANNTAPFIFGPDVDGTISSQGFNIVGNTAGSSGWIASDLQNTNPLLGALANNGGFTPTHALTATSPAINAGTSSGAPADDQRGYARNMGAIDIGAYEYNAAANQAPQSNDVSASGSEDAASIAITLNGSDGDGTVASFRLAGLPANGTLYTDAGLTTLANTSTDYPASGNALTLYFVPGADWNGSTSFTYAATDNLGLADATAGTATITVTVVNDPPAITSDGGGATASVNAAENQTAVTTMTSTDVDGGAPSYSIVGGADAALFSINSSTGALAFASAPNREAPTDANANNLYDVTVQVSDGNGGTDMQAIAVRVTNVNEPPVVNDQSFSVAENSANGTPVGTVIASDVDAGDTRSFNITAGNTGGAFTINTATGQITVANAAALDFETNPSFTLTVQVQDAGGLTDTATVTVNLTDVNDAPVITSNGGGASASVSIAENTTAGTTITATDADVPAQTLTYSLIGGADQGLFSINPSTGALSFNTAPNFESPADAGANNLYDVTVQVSDGNGGTDTQVIAVTVTDANDAPVITSNGGGASASVSIAENTTAVTTVSATDADLPAQSLTYSLIGGADQGLFSINPSTGALSFNTAPNFESPADAGANNLYDVTVQVSDGNGGTDMQAIAVRVTNVNEPPVVNDQAFPVAENSANGTPVGTVIASDVDAGDTRSFNITAGNTGGAFTINTATGQITVANAAALDFETNPTFTLTVQVQDAGGLTDTATVTVTLADVNEAPASDQPSDRPPQLPASTQGPDRQSGELPLSPEDEADSLTASSIAGAPTMIRQSIEGLARSSGRLIVPRDAIERPSFKLIAQQILSRIAPDQGRATEIEYGIRASDKLWAAIDRMKAEMDTDQGNDELVVVTGAGVALSVGFVAWLLRGGSLLASLLSTVPLWRGLDPLPILAYRRTKEDEKRRRQPAQEDASIEGLFSSPPGGQPQ